VDAFAEHHDRVVPLGVDGSGGGEEGLRVGREAGRVERVGRARRLGRDRSRGRGGDEQHGDERAGQAPAWTTAAHGRSTVLPHHPKRPER
jgi:hypothetical protein